MSYHWAQLEERGIIWGMEFLLKTYLLFGNKFLQFFLYPVVSYYWLINVKGRDASKQYLQKISSFQQNKGEHQKNYNSFQHFISFANALIDKLAAWSGSLSMQDVEYFGREAVINHIEQGQGVLLLGSHLGNLEVCRVIANLRKNVKVNVLVHTKHTMKFNKVLNKYADSGMLNLIQVSEVNAATAMMLQDKIEQGEIVVIAADRTPISQHGRIVKADFLGQSASFPQGPFILALLLDCPVFTMFCLKMNNKQMIYFDHFSVVQSFSRKQRSAVIQQSVEKYAQILQKYCMKAPLQWFNFFDFWQMVDE